MTKLHLTRPLLLTGLALIALALPLTTATASPYAGSMIDSGGTFGPSVYGDPYAILGAPSTDFYDPWGSWSGGTNDRRVKLVEPAYNTDAGGNNLITTFNRDAYAVVGFDHAVEDYPFNPSGIDLLVFGNAFFTGDDYVNDSTDMNTYNLTGSGWYEDVLVSVSPGYEGLSGQEEDDWGTWDWYDYTDGPYGDNAFPTQGYQWDADNATWTNDIMDFTKPVDPDLFDTMNNGGITAAEAIALYDGSGGGTGFDLAESGFASIQYVKVSTGDENQWLGGEIDAFADVSSTRPVPEPCSCALLGIGAAAVAGTFRRRRSRKP